jgi:hypothetical protein
MPSSLNGTGVTFNDGTTLQSGNIPAANLGSGTANSTTFLRGDRTWQTVSATPTTDQVLSATAGASVGAVGTYALLGETTTTQTLPGGTRAGSALRYAGVVSQGTSWGAAAASPISISGKSSNSQIIYNNTPPGTWRCMGHALGHPSDDYRFASIPLTLWLRIS